jgi:hypothetical protein
MRNAIPQIIHAGELDLPFDILASFKAPTLADQVDSDQFSFLFCKCIICFSFVLILQEIVTAFTFYVKKLHALFCLNDLQIFSDSYRCRNSWSRTFFPSRNGQERIFGNTYFNINVKSFLNKAAKYFIVV